MWIEGSLSKVVPSNADPSKVVTLHQKRAFVDRSVMSPIGRRSRSHIYTSLSAVDRHLDHRGAIDLNNDASWPKFWDNLLPWFEELFGAPLEDWEPEMMVAKPVIAVAEPLADTSGAIRRLYEYLDAESKLPALMRSLCLDRERPPADVRVLESRSHLGQIGDIHPLNQGQRAALTATLALKHGELVAINGPPGTGKTTLLQSVVASPWVAAAAEGGEPPVILASSTNNQAITNILASFASAALPADHHLHRNGLGRRWLPDLDQYGLYLPAQQRINEITHRLNRQGGKFLIPEDVIAYPTGGSNPWGGLPGIVENDTYVHKATEYYQACARQWSGTDLEVEDIVERLHRQLLNRMEAMRQLATVRRNLVVADTGLQKDGPFDGHAHQAALRHRLEETQSELKILGQGGHEALAQYHGIVGLLLGWLPPVRRACWNRALRLLADRNLADPSWTWNTVLDEGALRQWLSAQTAAKKTEIGHLTDLLGLWDQWKSLAGSLLDGVSGDELHAMLRDENRFEETLDTSVRAELFHLAGRYWEGRWLLLMKGLPRDQEKRRLALAGRSRGNCEARWRRFAMLTPCMVSTTYAALPLFDYYDKDKKNASDLNPPLLEFIDLLIVDEAGQVSPPVGAAVFALAKKALVVGDVHQIEPVWEVSDAIDRGNLAHHHLVADGEEPDVVEDRGLRASSGSIMRMAREATAFTEDAESKGILLREHWRCHPDVIAFCNDLAYEGKLVPMRKAAESYVLPRMGYAHVSGHCKENGTSRCNEDEARVIAHWLLNHRQELLEAHAKEGVLPSLGTIVGIVTPFKAQVGVIRRALRNAELPLDEAAAITVGTTHTFQGAERPVILFSSVYSSRSRPATLFFDRNHTILNVAVSRAKESFLVFGDMAIFQADGRRRPSSILAGHLYADPGNEITDVEPTLAFSTAAASIERVDTLDRHRELLREAIETAQDKLLIVSPYLSDSAIEFDGIVGLLSLAIHERGAAVTIAYDKQLNEGKPYAKRAEQLLRGIADLDLKALEGIHNKTLVVDESWIVEGSFNWLSAARKENHQFHRHEVSLVCKGDEAAEFSAKAWRHIEAMSALQKGTEAARR